jgi:hypothetical protein
MLVEKKQPAHNDESKKGSRQWCVVGGVRFYSRSQWERDYATYLEGLKQIGSIKWWKYESTTFWFEGIKRGTVSYKPDFEVMTAQNTIEFHEVKGYMDKMSATKLKRMKKYHPDVVVKLIDGSWFKKNRYAINIMAGVQK